MDSISWGVIVPVLVVIGLLYFVIRMRRKNRGR